MRSDAPRKPAARFLPAALLLFAAAAAGAEAPDAGSILQQIRPPAPPPPSPVEPGLKIEPQGGAKVPPSEAFEVRTIRIEGNTLFDAATLHALVADGEGRRLTLPDLQQLAARITDFYHRHGYPLARAIVPAQTVGDRTLTIRVIEARYGNIRLDNRSRVSDALLDATLSPLRSGAFIGEREMDRALLLLSDIPGVGVGATLKPGEAVGSSDLRVEVAPGPAVAGNLVVDNYGNRYIGRLRAGGSVSWANPLHYGDLLTAVLLGSGHGMDYGRIAYESVVSGQGTRVGGAYSALHYFLGDTLAPLDAHGTAQVGSLWLRHPLVRGTVVNLYGQLQYDRKRLRDRIDVSAIRTDRHADNWVLGLSGDLRDTVLGGGINTWSVAWTSGRIGFDDAAAQAADAATAGTRGRFSKWNAGLSRLQALTPRDALYFAAIAQWADGNLDSAEKMTLGGPYSVRAYDAGAVSGDTGYQGTIELRHDLGTAAGGRWQALAFVDSARVTVNEQPWAAGSNGATLTGAGVGLAWSHAGGWSARIYVASRVGPAPELAAGAAATRGWMEIGKSF